MLLLFALALIWVLLINSWRIRRKAGRSLLDLGRTGRLVGYAATMFGILLAVIAVFIAFMQANAGWLFYTFFFASLALMSFLDARTSRELRENGVLLPQQFIPWQRIKSYAWRGERMLTLETEKRWGFSARQRLRINPALKDAVDQILCQHLGNV
jgi:uncharacterized membrane protein YobD (UPF0266 family)